MVAYAKWKSEYSVGDESIDIQHKQILALISELHAAVQEGREYSGLKEPLDRMVAYTINHFKHEEQKMQACGFPDFANHKATHDQMRHRTEDLRKNITLVTARDLLRFLKDWWINHIMSEDQCYVPYLSAAARQRTSGAAPTQPVNPMTWPGQTPTRHY